MSRIGKIPIPVPSGVTVKVADGQVSVQGPKGNLSLTMRPEVEVEVAGSQVDAAKGMSVADIKYNTFGFGGVYYANPHMKFFVWYDMVTNEATAIKGYTKDVKDNVFTLRVQYTF